MKTATLVKDNLDSFSGHAALYKLSEPHEGFDHVVVSAVNTSFAHETYLFGADESGEVKEWGELDGSERNVCDHEVALSNAGYALQS